MNKLCSLMNGIKNFGMRYTALRILSTPKLKKFSFQNNVKKKYEKYVLAFLQNNFGHIVDDYRNKELENTCISETDPIWIFWWQGEGQAPDIVKACMKSIKQNCGKHPVIVLTETNYSEYVQIPEYILKKLDEKTITLTHFSDILRMSLLAEYGGIWMDATLYMNNEFPKELYKYGFYSNKLEYSEEYVSNCRWSAFFLCSSKGSILPMFVRDILFEYWKNYDGLIDYLLIDYIIATACLELKNVQKMVDCVPYNNLKIYELVNRLNNQWDQEEFDKMTESTWIFKLTWKQKFNESTLGTYYKKLILDTNEKSA